jgi:hypothetical protein
MSRRSIRKRRHLVSPITDACIQYVKALDVRYPEEAYEKFPVIAKVAKSDKEQNPRE